MQRFKSGSVGAVILLAMLAVPMWANELMSGRITSRLFYHTYLDWSAERQINIVILTVSTILLMSVVIEILYKSLRRKSAEQQKISGRTFFYLMTCPIIILLSLGKL